MLDLRHIEQKQLPNEIELTQLRRWLTVSLMINITFKIIAVATVQQIK